MAGTEENRSLRNLIRGIVDSAAKGGAKPSLRETEKHFRSLIRRDYRAALKRCFDRQQLKNILSELRQTLPTLNQQVFGIKDPRRLAKIASDMGATLQAQSFDGPTGRALRGFYVHDHSVLKRPLICVNTANHPVAVAAAFWHEAGHHLTKQIFGASSEHLNLTFSTNYQNHLEDPQEIAADILLTLGGYPKPVAERLFGKPEKVTHEADMFWLVESARSYVRSALRFDFDKRISATENLHYLAGIIHVAKLRSALLSEYGI